MQQKTQLEYPVFTDKHMKQFKDDYCAEFTSLENSCQQNLLQPDCDTFVIGAVEYFIAVANTSQQRKNAFKFLYSVYRESGLGYDHPSQMWYSLAELLPTSAMILIVNKADKEIAGCVSIVRDSQFGLPADDAFECDLNLRRIKGYRFAEVFSLGLATHLRGNRVALNKLFNYVQIVNYFLWGVTDLVVTVVPSHARFYSKMLTFKDPEIFGYHRKTNVACKLLFCPVRDSIAMKDEEKAGTCIRFFHSVNTAREISERLRGVFRSIDRCEFITFLNTRPEINNTENKLCRFYIDTMLKGGE